MKRGQQKEKEAANRTIAIAIDESKESGMEQMGWRVKLVSRQHTSKLGCKEMQIREHIDGWLEERSGGLY